MTVPVTGVPPLTDEAKLKLLGGGGVTVSPVFSVLAPEDAVNVTETLLHCGVEETGTWMKRVPAATVTLDGSEATEGLLLERLTGHPLAGAFAPR